MRWVLVSMLAGCITVEVEVSSGEPWALKRGYKHPDGTVCGYPSEPTVKDYGLRHFPNVERLRKCCEAAGAQLAFIRDDGEAYCR